MALLDKTRLNGLPPEVTGAQGFGTPAAQQNALVQGLGGSPSSSDAKGQSPADKLLSYASTFPTSGVPSSGEPPPVGLPIGETLPGGDVGDLATKLFPNSPPGISPVPPTAPDGGNQDLVSQLFPAAPMMLPLKTALSLALAAPAGPDPEPDPNVQPDPGVPPTTPPPAIPPPTVPSTPRVRPSQPPPTYSDANPPPKPPNTEDPEVFAAWARLFAYKNPDFLNITGADVTNQRMLAVSGKFAQMGHPEWQDFLTWYAAGKPGGQYEPAPQGDPNFGLTQQQIDAWWASRNQPPPATPPPATPPPTTPGPVTPPPVTPPPVTPPVTPPPTPPPATPPPPTWDDSLDIQPIALPDVSNDPWTQMLQRALATQKDVGGNQIRRQVTAAQAATGGLNQGGFAGSVARPIAEYDAELDKQGATALTAAHNSAMDRALQATIAERTEKTQLALGRMDMMSKKYTADQQLEGEKYRADISKAISDAQNISAEKISAAVNEKDLKIARINADAAASAAAAQAGAAAAAAGASAAAQKYASDMAYQGVIARIAADREQSQLQYNLGITKIGGDTYAANLQNQQFMLNLLKDMGPEQLAKYLFGGQPLPAPVYVQP